MPMGIYVISNTRNGVVYVGSAVDIERRWAQHRGELARGQHSNRQLQRDWNYYGADAFRFTVVETVARVEDLTPAEQRWIDHYIQTSGLHFLYNLQLAVPQRVATGTVVRQPAAQSGAGCSSCIAAPIMLLASLPWHYIIPCSLVGFLGLLVASIPGGIYFAVTGDNPPRYIGQTNFATMINGLSFLTVAVWFYVWYWRLHPPVRADEPFSVVCPDCSTKMPDSAKFCPGCGKPRTAVREEIQEEADRTGVDFDWLLEERRASEPEVATPQPFFQRWRMLFGTRSLRISLAVFAAWVVVANLALFLLGSDPPSVA